MIKQFIVRPLSLYYLHKKILSENDIDNEKDMSKCLVQWKLHLTEYRYTFIKIDIYL